MDRLLRRLSIGTMLALTVVAAPPAMAADPTWTGEWFGAYNCGDGVIQMTLNIEADTDGRMRARFDFSAPSSSDQLPAWAPLGSFSMQGSFTGDDFQLKAGTWIRPAFGYEPVDLAGRMTAGEISARIVGYSCTPLKLRR